MYSAQRPSFVFAIPEMEPAVVVLFVTLDVPDPPCYCIQM
jgi:hypothetical protein